MAANSLFPGFVKIFYTTNGHQHIMTQPVDPYVGVGGAFGLNTGNPGPGYFPWTAGIDAFVAVLRPLIHSSSSINRAELWTLAAPGADPIYQDTHEIELAGTSATVPQPNSQLVVSFRTTTGGLLRVYVMEGSNTVNQELFPPVWGNTIIANFVNYIASNTGYLKGRDGGQPKVGIRLLTKTNDALRKKYLLDS